MISIDQIRSLIQRVCNGIGEKFGSDGAVQLVLETGLVESRYKYLRQLGDGPARSFWQVEPATAVDNLQHYLKHRKKLMSKCAEVSLVDLMHWQTFEESLWSDILEKNLAASIIHCRVKYWRVPKSMPSSLEGRAKYWKQYYNSGLGAGSEEKYIEIIKDIRGALGDF
ncbi:MAG: hypothetical protein CMJ25_17935 [Phycisphaerae bacterium]|nr:hypothetical protein [Phycisphaerae bacterium]